MTANGWLTLIALRCGDIRADAGLLYRGELSDERVVIPVMCFAVVHSEGVNHDPDDWAECTDTLVLHREG